MGILKMKFSANHLCTGIIEQIALEELQIQTSEKEAWQFQHL
jgi:hypothetical protein